VNRFLFWGAKEQLFFEMAKDFFRKFAAKSVKATTMSQIKNIVFDFGGVIIDIDRQQAVKAFTRIGVPDADEQLDAYHQQGIFLQAEDGTLDAEAFRHALEGLCGRSFTYEEVESGWLGFMTRLEPYKLQYLLELRRRGYRVFILSNTNPYIMNWARSSRFTPEGKGLQEYVDKIYASYEMHTVKPGRTIFERMMADGGIRPEESVFVDDGTANAAMGRELGFRVLQPLNGEDWRAKLEVLLD
jgi:putative hydrolase of the HAD superfamily